MEYKYTDEVEDMLSELRVKKVDDQYLPTKSSESGEEDTEMRIAWIGAFYFFKVVLLRSPGLKRPWIFLPQSLEY